MTAVIPSTQDTQLDLRATNAKEFRELLGRIRDSAGLTSGQIASKTQMPRSTAYSLTSTTRQGLPSNEEQVLAFVKACGLTPTQVDVVQDLWRRLHNERENARDAAKAAKTRPGFSYLQQADKYPIKRNTVIELLTGCALPRDGGRDAVVQKDLAEIVQRWTPTAKPCDHHDHFRRVTTPLDLVHYVLADEGRYRRALRLVKVLSLLAFVFVGGVVAIAVLVPSTAFYLGTGLVTALIVAVGALGGGLRIGRSKRAHPRR